MKLCALLLIATLDSMVARANNSPLLHGAPEWEWLEEPVAVVQEAELQRACDGFAIYSSSRSDDGRLLVVLGSNGSIHVSYSLYLFRLNEEGRAIARLSAPSTPGVYGHYPAIKEPALIEFSRHALIAPGTLKLPARFAFDSPKPGRSD